MTSPTYNPAFDSVRGIAVLLVVLTHSALHVPGGPIGVDLFFVLSGFLITRTLPQSAIAPRDLLEFYRRRWLRLAPALGAFAVAYGAFGYWRREQIPEFASDIIAAISYVSNFSIVDGIVDRFPIPYATGPSWTLALEEQFYLGWPLVLMTIGNALGRRAALILVGAIVALVLVWRIWFVLEGFGYSRIYYASSTRVDTLLTGCGLALIGPESRRKLARLWPFALGVLMAGALLVPTKSPVMLTVGFTVVALCAAVLVAAAGADTHFAKFGRLRPLVWIGLISYPLYLWHYPILISLRRAFGLDEWGATLIGVPLSLAIATASYLLIERRFLAIRYVGSKEGHAKTGRIALISTLVLMVGGYIYLYHYLPAPR